MNESNNKLSPIFHRSGINSAPWPCTSTVSSVSGDCGQRTPAAGRCSQTSVEIPQVQLIDKVTDVPVIMQRQVPAI